MLSTTTRALLVPKILRSVVAHSLPDPITFPFHGDFRLQLLLVSKDWRDTVMSEEFWTRYCFMALPVVNAGRELHVLRAFISRSGSNALAFYFLADMNLVLANPANPDPNLYFGRGRIDILHSIVLPYASRLRFLQCFIPTPQLLRLLRGISQGSLQSLEDVNLACTTSALYPRSLVHGQQIGDLKLFKSLPRLRRVRLYIWSPVKIRALQMLSSPITSLDIGNSVLSPTDFMAIFNALRGTLHIGTFTVQFDSKSCRLKQRWEKVEMVKLEVLLIRFVDLSHWPEFPRLLVLRGVKEFRVERAETRLASVSWDVPMYTELLAASAHTLEHLVLSSRRSQANVHERKDCQRTSYTDLEDLFRTLPNLVAVSLPLGLYIHIETVAKIAGRELLPRCQTFQFATDVDIDVVLAMVAMRNKPPDPTPSNLAYITALTLTVPMSFAGREQYIRSRMASYGLNAQRNFGLYYVETCEGCAGHCCFGL